MAFAQPEFIFDVFGLFVFGIRQKAGEQSQEGQEGTEVEDVVDACFVGKAAQDSGADAAHAKGQSEEEPGDEPHFSRHQFLRIDEDGGEGGGEDEADDDAEDCGPGQVGVGQDEGEGQDSEDADPDDVLAAVAVSDRAADEGSGGDCGEEEEEEHL